MFSGIVEDIGLVVSVVPRGKGVVLCLSTGLPLEEIRVGDSLSVSGACLSVTAKEKGRFFEEGGEVIVAAPRGVPRKDADRLRARGARVLLLPARKGRIGADAFLAALGSVGITSLLVEGGGKTAGWLVEAGAVDRHVFFLAPLLLGEGIRSVSGFAARRVNEGRRLVITKVARADGDIVLVAEPPPGG